MNKEFDFDEITLVLGVIAFSLIVTISPIVILLYILKLILESGV